MSALTKRKETQKEKNQKLVVKHFGDKPIEVKMINGKPHVRVKDLKNNPTNEKIYDQSAVDEIADDFLRRQANGLVINVQPVTYWSDGTIDLGHSRTGAAIKAGIEWIWAIPSDGPYPSEEAPYDEVCHTASGNIVRQFVPSVKLFELQALKDSYKKQFNFDMPTNELNKHLKRLKTTKQTIDKLTEIHAKKPELLKMIDDGEMSIKTAWLDATGQLKAKVKLRKNGMDLAKLFEDKSVQSKICAKANKYVQDIRDLDIPFDEFTINPFSQDECGKWESTALTTITSHTYMSCVAGALKEMGFDVKTANGNPDDPDIRFKGYGDENDIEVKVVQFRGHGSQTKWKGGGGYATGKFVLVCHDLEFKRIFVAFSSIIAEDWGSPDAHGKKTISLNTWYNNHKDDKDLQIWMGNVHSIATTKQPDGQVQMTLDLINEPIK